MKANHKSVAKQAKRLKNQPVCVVLKDGSYYIGRLHGIEQGQLIFSGTKGAGNFRNRSRVKSKQARISGLNSPLAAAAPQGEGAGLLGGLGGIGDFMGMIQKVWPMIKMGMGMVKTIMPLFGGLKL